MTSPKPTHAVARPLVPAALDIGDALDRSSPLRLLRERLADSRARFDAVRDLLPGPLAEHVRPGPVDDTGWTLLAGSTAVAAKLRQLLPRIEQRLVDRGWQVSATKVRVQSS